MCERYNFVKFFLNMDITLKYLTKGEEIITILRLEIFVPLV